MKIRESALEHVDFVADAIAHEPDVAAERGEVGDGVDDLDGDGRAFRARGLRVRRQGCAELGLC